MAQLSMILLSEDVAQGQKVSPLCLPGHLDASHMFANRVIWLGSDFESRDYIRYTEQLDHHGHLLPSEVQVRQIPFSCRSDD